MAKFFPNKRVYLLDIATGTGDVILSLIEKNVRLLKIVAIDMSKNMLIKGKNKAKIALKNSSLKEHLFFLNANAMRLPLKDSSFDVVTIAFGIRNMSDYMLCLKEVYRVLKSNGKLIILEFSLPNNFILKSIYFFYLRFILPFTGRIISGDPYAYRYLNRTIETFPYGKDFLDILTDAGFNNTKMYPQTWGVCTIYIGDK